MPRSRTGRILFASIVSIVLLFAGRNMYRRYLNVSLVSAIRARDVATVRSVLMRGADPNTRYYLPRAEHEPQASQPVLEWVLSGLALPDRIVRNPSGESRGGEFQPSYLPDTRAEAIARLLIEKGAHLQGANYLVGACNIGDVAVARCLLEHGAEVKSPAASADALGAALQYAISLNTVSMNGEVFSQATTQSDKIEVARRVAVSRQLVQLLRDHGAHPTLMQAQTMGDRAAETEVLNGDPTTWDDEGYGALSVAAHKGDLYLIGQLLGHGVDPNRVPGPKTPVSGRRIDYRFYDLPLHAAADRGNMAAVKLLLAHGADPNGQQPYALAPLAAAARSGSLKLVALLLAHGADPNRTPPGTETPLTVAAGEGSLPMVQLLIAHGAKLNSGTTESAVQSATRRGRMDVVRYLIEHGADPNGDSYRPLLCTALRFAPQVVPYLLTHGVNVNPRVASNGNVHAEYNDEPASPLISAAWYAPQFEPVLLQAGGKIGQDKATGCVVAAQHGRTDLLPRLVSYGADVNGMSSHHETALSICIGRSPASVKMLLEHGANPNVETRNHRTALEEAAMIGNAETVRLLLAHGADVNAHPDRHSALEWARRKKHPDIAVMLQRAGAKE